MHRKQENMIYCLPKLIAHNAYHRKNEVYAPTNKRLVVVKILIQGLTRQLPRKKTTYLGFWST